MTSRTSRFDDLALTTERLHLRPLRHTDASAVFSIFSDPKVMRYWSSPPWDTIEQAHELIEREAKSMSTGEGLRFAVVRRNEGDLIATCTLFAISQQCRRAEIGYGMASHAWGRGYMDEALRELLDYGFRVLDLNRIEADIDPRNASSARTLERLGFRQEGYLRERWIVGDEISDSALYGLLRKEWRPGSKSIGKSEA